ncbi:hypothetical protein [Rhizobium leguminosarum]|uniref:Uncharacterized protein n=1 Tax=Rhizobium leguminosarum TaxID=384 RepID=A0A7K3VGC8_RHILE|nr:hypothetical protein [Rhizobium leguminosarum]NEK16203.1 hypothetical protein [Rhizobium leguminosarum]
MFFDAVMPKIHCFPMGHLEGVMISKLLRTSGTLFILFAAPDGLADDKLPTATFEKNNPNRLQVTGILSARSKNARPCTYHDPAHAVFGQVDGLKTVTVPDRNGVCFDVSVRLPDGYSYASHSARIEIEGSSQQAECKPIDPLVGSGTCFPRTVYKGNDIEWGHIFSRAFNECKELYAACGADIGYFEFLVPKLACDNIGEKYSTANAYFAIADGSKDYRYIIEIDLNTCGNRGGFEAN